MDLADAQRLLRNPRALTRAQWNEAYLAIQEHTIRGGTDRSSDTAASVVNDRCPDEVTGDHPTG